jgi:hypothetical protein
MASNLLQEYEDLENVMLAQLGASPPKPSAVPDLDLSQVYHSCEEEMEEEYMEPVPEENVPVHKDVAPRLADYPVEELDNSVKLHKLQQLRMEKIRKIVKQRVEHDRKLKKRFRPSETLPSDPSSFNIEMIISSIKEESKSKPIATVTDLYEVQIKNRIKESSSLLKRAKNSSSIIGKSLIHAVLSENLRFVEAHLDSCQKDVDRLRVANTKDQFGRTALHYASALGLEKPLKLLLAVGADPFSRDFKSRSPLHYAGFANCPKTVPILMRGQQQYRATFERLLSLKNRNTVARSIMHARTGADPKPAPQAAELKPSPVVELDLRLFHEGTQNLVQEMNRAAGQAAGKESSTGKYVDLSDNEGRTALHLAVLHDRATVVQVLLDVGANFSAEDAYGKRPLELSRSQFVSSLILARLKQALAQQKARHPQRAGLIDNRDLRALSQEDISALTKTEQLSYLM